MSPGSAPVKTRAEAGHKVLPSSQPSINREWGTLALPATLHHGELWEPGHPKDASCWSWLSGSGQNPLSAPIWHKVACNPSPGPLPGSEPAGQSNEGAVAGMPGEPGCPLLWALGTYTCQPGLFSTASLHGHLELGGHPPPWLACAPTTQGPAQSGRSSDSVSHGWVSCLPGQTHLGGSSGGCTKG